MGKKVCFLFLTLRVLESMVAVIFQSVFYSKMHQHNIFLFFKKIFFISTHQSDHKNIKS